MSKAIALYGSHKRSKDSQAIDVAGKPYYIRAEVISQRGNGGKHWLANALLLAQSRPGEVLLNTVHAAATRRARTATRTRRATRKA
jgi:hypothetical protein